MNEKKLEITDASEFLGPFLCKPTSSSMSFWFSTPTKMTSPIISIEGVGSCDCSKVNSAFNNLPFHVWIGTINNLKPNTEYEYKVTIDDRILIFSNNSDCDFKFRTLRDQDHADADKFILLSCHGVDEYEAKLKNKADNKILKPTFNMWQRLLSTLNDDSDIRFGFFAGDQVYMDEDFNKYLISKRKNIKDDSEIFETTYMTYRRFWSNVAYRKVLARLPVFLMWDDHDIVDGWGSRDEQFDILLKEKWEHYFNIQKENFYLMQASRNPVEKNKSNFYFSFEHGSSLFSVFDLRTERDKTVKKMLSNEQKEKFENEIHKSNARDHFIISSVTMARMGSDIENTIGKISNLIWSLSSKYGYGPNMIKFLMWLLLAGFALLPHVVIYNYSYFLRSENLVVFISAYLFLKYKNKFKYFFGSKAVMCLGSLTLVSLLAFIADLNFFTQKFQLIEGFQIINYNTLRGLLLMFLVSVLTGINFLSSAPKFKKINLCLYFFGWSMFFILSDPVVHKFSSLLLSLIASVAIVFAILEASGKIDLVAGLDDDIEDSWSAQTNSLSFSWFLEAVANSKLRTTVLSGDIHTAGLSQLVLNNKKIPQVVSSPITYPVMSPLVEKLTSSPKVQNFKYDHMSLDVYNLFYRSERNFCVISKVSDQVCVDYFFEDLDKAIALHDIHKI